MTDAQLAAEFARDLGIVALALFAAWCVVSVSWFLCGLWKEWRR